MKLSTDPRIPRDAANLSQRLNDLHRDIAQQVNGMAEGRLAAHYSAQTAAPTTGTHAQGDFVRNSAPVEAGVALSRYVVTGWLCVSGGTPGTWLQCRVLTGN